MITPTIADQRSASNTKSSLLLRIATVLLVLWALTTIPKGMADLLYTSDAIDLHQRWSEQQYVFHRQNPYDVWARVTAIQQGHPPPVTDRDTTTLAQVGAPGPSGYPPWHYFSASLYLWPSWTAARYLFALINLLALTTIGAWVFATARHLGRERAIFLTAAVIALSAHCSAIGVGNYGTVVVGLLAAAIWCDSRGYYVAAGILFGVATLKPNIAGPFLIPLLAMRRWRSLTAAGAYLVVASGVMWAVVRTSPWEMLRQMAAGGTSFAESSISPVNGLMAFGVDRRLALPLVAIMTLALASLLIFRLRRGPLVLFAVAAVAGRLWTYHKHYDNQMLTFLLVPLGLLVLQSRSRTHQLAFATMAVLLWLPQRMIVANSVGIILHVSWVAGMVALLLPPADVTDHPENAAITPTPVPSHLENAAR